MSSFGIAWRRAGTTFNLFQDRTYIMSRADSCNPPWLNSPWQTLTANALFLDQLPKRFTDYIIYPASNATTSIYIQKSTEAFVLRGNVSSRSVLTKLTSNEINNCLWMTISACSNHHRCSLISLFPPNMAMLSVYVHEWNHFIFQLLLSVDVWQRLTTQPLYK